MDLRQIKVSIFPNITDAVLPDTYTPVILMFDTGMVKNEVEGIMQISSDLGTVRGDKLWIGNHLYFVPVSGWTAGIRYTLSLAGTLRSTDGRELRIEQFTSFYAVNRNSPPVLKRHSPSNGESIGTNDVVIEFHFSRSMERLTVESAFSLDGISSRTFEWTDDQTFRVIIERPLSPWTMFRWTIRSSAKSVDGVPLPKEYTGYFTTDLDQTLPRVVNVFPVLNTNGRWYPTGADIETGLGIGQGIAIEFNKPMGDNALRSVRFEPSLTGRAEFLSEKSIVYIFTRDPEPDTTYTLIVSGDIRDTEGLKTGSDFRINFTPDFSFLYVLSFTVDGNAVNISSASNNVLPVSIDPGTGLLGFSIQFNLLFGFEEKLTAPQRITLAPFFPRTLAPVALQYVNWISDDRLFLRWEGLLPGNDGIPNYYMLTIPGGKGGINSGSGLYIKDNIIIYLEAVR
jgi:hypothetical protein